MKLTVNLFDVIKLEELIDSNEYLNSVLTPIDGYWYIEADDACEIERLLKKNRIRFKIKI